MKIRVIGGGWYGCYLATQLRDHDVTLFERGPKLFCGASGNNQSRLHLGFHYPRCAWTRREAVAGFTEFMRELPQLTRGIRTNLYAVAKTVSLIDYETYAATMRATGLEFLPVDPKDFGLTNLEGAMLTGERLILADTAREYFAKELGASVRLETEADPRDGADYDLTIDCSFGAFRTPEIEWFEPCILLLYEGDTDFALTVMDGPDGCSIYPYYRSGLVSLTTVRETPMARCMSMEYARTIVDGLREEHVSEIAGKMEARVCEYMPEFPDWYERVGHACAIRVKPKSATDRRSHVINGDEGFISVFPGKISGIFDAARDIRGLL